jgi:hypothetical protein
LKLTDFFIFGNFLIADVSMSFSQDMDNEYEKLIRRMNPPRVVIDNDSCKKATVIRVDSANEYGILLEVVQILTDLNLTITKAYISSDGGWFMDGMFRLLNFLFFWILFTLEQGIDSLILSATWQYLMSLIKMVTKSLMKLF